MAYQDFAQFSVWKKGHMLLEKVYAVSREFPKEEKYGLTSDIRRAANSIIHNIAEGFGRYENLDKTRFYKISRGSAYEIISQLYTSKTLTYIESAEMESLCNGYKEIIDELDKLIRAIESR